MLERETKREKNLEIRNNLRKKEKSQSNKRAVDSAPSSPTNAESGETKEDPATSSEKVDEKVSALLREVEENFFKSLDAKSSQEAPQQAAGVEFSDSKVANKPEDAVEPKIADAAVSASAPVPVAENPSSTPLPSSPSVEQKDSKPAGGASEAAPAAEPTSQDTKQEHPVGEAAPAAAAPASV